MADSQNGRSPRYVTPQRCDLALLVQLERNRSQQAMIAWQQRAGPAEHSQGRKPAEPVAHRASLDGAPLVRHGSHAIMAGHPAEHAPQDATLRWVALGLLIPNAFFVGAALRRFARCRYSAIQNDVQTNTYDPRWHGATPSLLSCRQLSMISPSAVDDLGLLES
jgi:hypothetical protein